MGDKESWNEIHILVISYLMNGMTSSTVWNVLQQTAS